MRRWRQARRLLSVAALGLVTLSSGCGDSRTPTEPSTGGASFPFERSTEHFLLRYGEPAAPLVDAYAAALEQSWPRITQDLGQPAVGRVEGFLHPDQASFTARTGYNATGSVDGPTRFHLVAVPLRTSDAVHEFAHNVTLHVAPFAGNNPVWLWEAIAVYEARQLVPPSSLPYLVAGEFPTLAELNQRGGRYSIYDVGYVLAEFIVDGWGLEGLRRLLLAGGDTERGLGLSAATFEERWKEFVRRRYL